MRDVDLRLFFVVVSKDSLLAHSAPQTTARIRDFAFCGAAAFPGLPCFRPFLDARALCFPFQFLCFVMRRTFFLPRPRPCDHPCFPRGPYFPRRSCSSVYVVVVRSYLFLFSDEYLKFLEKLIFLQRSGRLNGAFAFQEPLAFPYSMSSSLEFVPPCLSPVQDHLALVFPR